MTFTPIGSSLHKGAKNSGLKKQLDADRVVENANIAMVDIFGEDYEKHVKPLYLKNRTLTVSCNSSTAAQEVRLNQVKIVDSINNMLGTIEVDRIRYLL
jgi:hypothetical protein